MISDIYIKKYSNFPINELEILRYAGCSGADESSGMYELMRICTKEVIAKCACTFNICYRILPIKSMNNDEIDFELVKVKSRDLYGNLEDCNYAVFLAGTIGQAMDRIIKRYEMTDPSKAVFMQAIGAERVETMLDAFCKELPGILGALANADTELTRIVTKPRFSPGYGDLPLEMQKDFISILDMPRKIGVTLNDSLLMSPSKSVTAIVGVIL